MIYPDISVEEWLKLHESFREGFSEICEECGNRFTKIRPFVEKHYKGIECECEICDEVLTINIPCTKEKIDMWNSIL